MNTRRSKEEKERLIEDYKSSALSITEWCVLNNIPRSTMAEWLNRKSKEKSETKFIEVTIPDASHTKQTSHLTINYKDFKISVHEEVDFRLLENTLRVVTRLNV